MLQPALVPDFFIWAKTVLHTCALFPLVFVCGWSGRGFNSHEVWIVPLLSHSLLVALRSNAGLGEISENHEARLLITFSLVKFTTFCKNDKSEQSKHKAWRQALSRVWGGLSEINVEFFFKELFFLRWVWLHPELLTEFDCIHVWVKCVSWMWHCDAKPFTNYGDQTGGVQGSSCVYTGCKQRWLSWCILNTGSLSHI